MENLTKWLIIGLSTVAISGTLLLGTGMYAASTGNIFNQGQASLSGRGMGWPENMINSLSGKVSTEALSALQTLMTKHRVEMDAQRNSWAQPTQAQMDSLRTEMDALMARYPELKTVFPGIGTMRWGNRGQNGINSILSGVSATDKQAIESIRSEYQSKHDALRTEERAKIDSILVKYPEIQAKFDAAQINRPSTARNHGWKKW